jgi:hypothetical protein
MLKTGAVLCTLLLALTACGGGDESAAKDSIKASLLDNPDLAGGTEMTDEEAGCVSDGMVDDLGVEKLQDYKLLDDNAEIIEDAQPDDFSAEDADALADTIVGCVDVEELLSERMGATMEQMTDEQASCITDAFDEDTIKDIISAGFQGEDATSALPGDLQEQVMGCVGGATG